MTTGRILLIVAVVLIAIQIVVAVGVQGVARWEVVSVRDPVRIDFARGRPRMDGPAPDDPLRPGLVITGPDSELTVRLGDRLRLHYAPNTALVLPPPPARWFGRQRWLTLQGGEIWLACDEGLDESLRLDAGQARLRMDGGEWVVRRQGDAVTVMQLRGRMFVRRLDGGVNALEGEVGLELAAGVEARTVPLDEAARALAARLAAPPTP